jgi:sodium/bile acid cotransporter 7
MSKETRHFLPETVTLLLDLTVLLASLLPISGERAEWFGLATKIASTRSS